MKYVLEHARGVAGADETVIECLRLTEKEALDSPPEVVLLENTGKNWPIKMEIIPCMSVLWTAENPNAENRAGAYCDYWMLSKEEEEV